MVLLKVVIILGERLIALENRQPVRLSSCYHLIPFFSDGEFHPQMVPFLTSIVTGYMAFSDMKLRVRATGLVGTVPPLNSCASVDSCITKLLTAVIGQRFVDSLVFVEDSLNF